jgi:hypothetical protein
MFIVRMKVITGTLLTLALSMLANRSYCAGQAVEAQTKLLEAPTTINVAGVPLSFEPLAYLNLMPGLIISPDRKIDCMKEGPLIVLIRISTAALPADTQMASVWVHSDGNWWSGQFNTDETRKEGDHLVMIARGCPTQSFNPGTFVDVIVGVQHEQTILYLRAPKRQLEAAY